MALEGGGEEGDRGPTVGPKGSSLLSLCLALGLRTDLAASLVCGKT